ncbi:saxiphilin-like [Anomaloglossus baeobatrachus]|uniref:saxiphilin-like n=1 Tax=Anomaloglossus baeobatrachus TaxID=238106 RepID=UPI003F4F968F
MRMTPALQVLLCLSLLVLSSAAPNARKVRWCVTSDAEEQKCNDLVNSCHVDEILLQCVKKSSTEDCVSAISNGEADAISLDSKDVYRASLEPFNLKPIVTEGYSEREHTPCMRHRQSVLGGKPIRIGAFVPKCDEKGNYAPKQCHGSTGYCWCLNENGDEIEGTRTPPGTKSLTCEDTANKPPCLKERQKLLSAKASPTVFVPECDEKGNYRPQQCQDYCWCVDQYGEEIFGSRTFPGKPPNTCEASGETPCIKNRNKVLSAIQPLLGAFLPDCDEKGYFRPKQCHESTGHCWCATKDGEEIQGTRTVPGQLPPTCEVTAPVTLHYAVAVVKKSSSFQFDQLKGKRSCHSAVGEAAGWAAPFNVLLQKKLLSWEEPEQKSIEKVASEFFSASCAPGAKEAKLCEQCAGQEDKCKRGPGEPYYGDEGAFRCLRDDKGDVAFVEDSALSGQYSDNFELLCSDNTRKLLSHYKTCNFGRVPRHAVVTRSSGDQMKDITEYLLQAQKKECKLFSSAHGKDLLFEDTTTKLIALPSAMDTFFFLGPELFNGMKTLDGARPPSNQEIRWCPQSMNEKKKCEDWSSVSGGAIKCTEPSSAVECIEKILKGEAEAVTVGLEDMYTALKCGLVPSIDEYYNKNDLIPCQIPGSDYTDFGTFRVVAVVKKADKEITWNNLEGKKSCHTGVSHMAGWHIPVTFIHKKTKTCDIGSYFSQSCAPGSAIDSNLCQLCIGDPENPEANTKCSLSDKEAYYGNEGAIRCLVEKGDVAFVPHTAVYENTDGKNPALWAKDLKSTDFELLCPDGSRAPVNDYKKCRLSGIPPQNIVTRSEKLRDIVRITLNQQSLYGRNGFQKDIFQMFSSSHGQNLLFSDRTQCLVEFDRMHDRDVMDDVFGKPLYKALYKENNCLPKSALATACSFHH